jgi:hypothetical protein
VSEAKKGNGCPQCGGETAKATLKAGNADATLVIAGKPDGFLGVIPYTTSQVGARVCLNCARIDLFARNVRDLLRIGDDAD